MTLDKFGQEYGSSWEGMSMGEGRKIEPGIMSKEGECPKSPDGKHHYTAVSCVQSVEHFVCDYCPDDWWD
jgi:hypothetical protein